eukprot:5974971-Pleurochrysis_carterae.AAC.1
MGRFDEHCRGFVDRSLKSASISMSPCAFDSVTMAAAGQIDLAHADAGVPGNAVGTTPSTWHRGAMPLAP